MVDVQVCKYVKCGQLWSDDINNILTCLLRSLFLNSHYCLQLRLLVHYWKLRHTWYV